MKQSEFLINIVSCVVLLLVGVKGVLLLEGGLTAIKALLPGPWREPFTDVVSGLVLLVISWVLWPRWRKHEG